MSSLPHEVDLPRQSGPSGKSRWGTPPWTIDFSPQPQSLPEEADFAVVGGGFTGLSAAATLKRLSPQSSVVLLEAESIGAGASGRTGGMALAESAVGDLPGLGDVLGGLKAILSDLRIDCDLELPGAWEIGRKKAAHSPICWEDSGTLRVQDEVPGGRLDPGKLVSGLARAAEEAGAHILENARVEDAVFGDAPGDATLGDPLQLRVGGRSLRAGGVLFASNAGSLELSGLAGRTEPIFTLALATEPLSETQLEALGLASKRSFYTVDFPYLWGRLLSNSGIVFGAGLVHVNNWRELEAIDVSTGEAAALLNKMERRVHGLHPVLRDVGITHRWGGPILIGENWAPVFRRHPKSPRAIVLGGYSGHGVALSVYLGRWAAEALLGPRELPAWDET